jgi:hypothetical protein
VLVKIALDLEVVLLSFVSFKQAMDVPARRGVYFHLTREGERNASLLGKDVNL